MAKEIMDWLREMVYSSGGRGAIFGLSGGLDSSVVAVLCSKVFGPYSLGLIMPCFSEATDRAHAELVADIFDIPVKVIDLDAVFTQMLLALTGEGEPQDQQSLAAVNIKPRLRMAALYYWSARKHFRVIGSGNKSEILIGYFTKHGDSGVDLEPLGSLLKEDVWELARYLGIPREIIEKPPTAGLWKGQTDEDEMGFSYDVLDAYLNGEKIAPDLQDKIKNMQKTSEHKRNLPPIFPNRE
ncbi:MAG: NAD(+) synthase [Firmicutes bacterium]|nr:NAD(+) synthase [Bacillota bacterium]